MGGCGLLGAFAFTHGTAGGYSVLWLASGTYLALALRTLLSVGAVFLAAASLTAFALIRRPTSSGLPWWHPRYLGAGLLAFTVTLWTFFILTLPGNPGG